MKTVANSKNQKPNGSNEKKIYKKIGGLSKVKSTLKLGIAIQV